MEDSPRVVALCGSLRDASKTRVALDAALDAAGERGASTALTDLGEYELPAFDADDGAVGDALALAKTVDEADVVLLGTPNYHGSYSGVLKNALDYLGRDEFAGKTVGLLEVAGGKFPGSALAHLRGVARTLNAWTLPTEVAVPRSHSTIRGGEIVDESVADRVSELGSDAVEYACVGADESSASTATSDD